MGDIESYTPISIQNPVSSTVVCSEIELKCNRFAGLNKFTIVADAASTNTELDETNNIANFNLDIPGEESHLLSPSEYSIVSSANTNLVFQSDDIATFGSSFNLELEHYSRIQ